VHAVACVKDGDTGRTLRWSCALWRALVEFYGEGKGGSNPEGEVVEDEVRGPTVWSVSDLSATRTQGTEVCFTSDLCVSVMLSRSHLFGFAIFSQSRRQAAYVKHTMLRAEWRLADSQDAPWWVVVHAVACRGETDLSPH
jgi:hypothetical protein